MNTTSLTQRYSAKARWFHWVMAGLIVLAYVLILSRGQFAKGSDARMLVIQSHFWVGLLVFLMAFFRVAERHRHAPPGVTPPLEGALLWLANASHYALYGFLFVQPLLGVSAVLAKSGALPIPLIHMEIPSPFAVSKPIAESLEHLHVWLATIFYYVIGLHVLAALWHHFVRRDDTVRRIV